MKGNIRTSWIIALGLITLFFASWAITATITGNPITFESYETLESELVKDDFRGTQAFMLGLLLVITLGVTSLIVPYAGRNRYTNMLLLGSIGLMLLAGISSGFEPYRFDIGIVEQDVFEKPPLPRRGQILYAGIGVVGVVSFLALWADVWRQRIFQYEDEETVQYDVLDEGEHGLN